MSETLNLALLELHEGCRSRPVARFKNWAFDLAHSVVPFAYANWANAVMVDGAAVTFNACERGVDADFSRRLNENLHLDKRLPECFARVGEPVLRDGHDPADVSPEFRRMVLDPYGVRYAAMTIFVDPVTGVLDGIVLMRTAAEPRFGEEERILLRALVPHLHQTRVANQIERGCDVLDAGLRAAYHTLISSNEGLVLAAENEASAMLLREWPDWTGGRLPEALTDAVTTAARHGVPASLYRRSLVARLHPGPDQTLVRLRVPNAVDTLGRRELEVAECFAAGASHKEIARSFGLSPSTVSNQLSSIYGKLGISNKSELTRHLDQWR